ncbi:ParB/RepB/Spo0J family partition protein [Shimia sp. MMG029]|uniref:ParB/RepB/Spo0J family partition protein n=1 Tax=Shimia sp. MMG029 TaxID=3021978 RepID=UPI0022FDFFB3|nr:ParB/RepB/Spo0J family partition protein [Shimia sp. MMG029]MDA5557723.1 ParB/RepB/Spo0J family partition protein [Shimia sp. MMG029]
MTKVKQGLKSPKSMRLAISQLKTEPETFQYRAYETDGGHVKDLASAIQGGSQMDPMTVWHRGEDDFVILNGHHRHAAYTRCKYTRKITVTVHACTEAEAKLIAIAESTKTKLPMTNTEKMDAAWRLVCSDHAYSRKQLVQATGAADGTIANMRRCKKAFNQEEMDIPTSWWLAQRTLKGLEQQEWDEDMQEQMIATRAKALDDAIGEALGKMGRVQWEAVARVLDRRLNKQTLGFVVDWLRDDEEDEDDFPF